MSERNVFNHGVATQGGIIDACILNGINDVDTISQSTSLPRGLVLVHLRHLKREHGLDFDKGVGEFVICQLKSGWDGSNKELAALCRKIFGGKTKAGNIGWYKNHLKNSAGRNRRKEVNKEKRVGKSRKGALIKGMTKKLPFKILENPVFKSKLNEIMQGYAGIYALYNNDALYYVGLTNNLRTRINHHLKDRHANKWNEFVIFRIKHVKYLKDIETLLLNIHHTKGNRVKGKVPLDGDINRILLDIVREHKKEIHSLEKVLR
ncbi:MAG: GIY-YIG nuclease family protein [Nitrospinae bacterium]|nr:GIY-YIG nuclease family protein [Nitrospinota bacterium]